MRIGILKTGGLPDALVERHGDYHAMFDRLLKAADPGVRTFSVDVEGGEMPAAPDDADGWLITGSRHGAYEDHPWIPPLEAFLRACLEARVPVFGVCFGHQILAQALGGRVEKSARGWGFGVQDYRVAGAPGWLAELGEGWAGFAVHQDQVEAVPAGARVLAGNAHCPVAALSFGPDDAPHAASVQSHPEFTAPFVHDLGTVRLADKLPAEQLEAGLASLARPVDNAAWGRAVMRFFRTAAAARRAA